MQTTDTAAWIYKEHRAEVKSFREFINHAKDVYVIVLGSDDTVWVPVSKRQASLLAEAFVWAGCEVRIDDEGSAIIDRKD